MGLCAAILDGLSKYKIEALINFGAVFSGIAASFWWENKRQEKQDRETFVHLLQSLYYKSSHNDGVLKNMQQTVAVGSTFVVDLDCATLTLVLGHPTFHRWASYTLIASAVVVKNNFATLNNILAHYRQATLMRGGILESGINELKIRAETGQNLISIMQKRIKASTTQFSISKTQDPEEYDLLQRELSEVMGRERYLIMKNLPQNQSNG